MKKILLIGKNGQLASEIIKDAVLFDFEVIAFSKEDLDITNESQLKVKLEQIKPDIVINTAVLQIMSQCESDPYRAFQINFLAVQNLARQCKAYNVILVTVSSDAVFLGHQNKLNEEMNRPEPLQIFGLSKLAGEYAALAEHPQGTYIIRTCGLYSGLTGSPVKGNFVLNMIKEARAKDEIEVSLEQIVSPTYAGDLSKAVLKLLNIKAEPGVYHLINEGCCSWYEFTQEIFKLAGINKKLRGIDRGGYSGDAKRPKFSALKNTKARALGIVLPDWQEGLADYIKFLKNNNAL